MQNFLNFRFYEVLSKTPEWKALPQSITLKIIDYMFSPNFTATSMTCSAKF